MMRISREALKEMIDRDEDQFTLVDAREEKAFEKEHIPGAISIPSSQLGENALGRLDKDETIVTYCSNIHCEACTIAAEKLEKYGYERVMVFKGGLKNWKDAGYATEKA
ncbi:MAG: rhodanese-like domain-containing protein [Candidatus Thermoplasmatota archaeon]|nr:rhodanese-like domain-containing protein [Candidatus Thermoplasmatota archaeon]